MSKKNLTQKYTKMDQDKEFFNKQLACYEAMDPSTMTEDQFDELIHLYEMKLKEVKAYKRKFSLARKKTQMEKMISEADVGRMDYLEKKRNRSKEYKKKGDEDEVRRLNYWYKKAIQRLGQQRIDDLEAENNNLKRQLGSPPIHPIS